MAIVGEPFNVNAHAKIPVLFLNMLLSNLCLKMSSFLHTMPRIVFEIFYYKANTCANNLALSLIVFCPLLHCRHSCQFTFSWVCRVHCLCYVCTLILYSGLLYCTVVQKFLSDRSEHRIHPGDTTQTPPPPHKVKCWARVPRLKNWTKYATDLLVLSNSTPTWES